MVKSITLTQTFVKNSNNIEAYSMRNQWYWQKPQKMLNDVFVNNTNLTFLYKIKVSSSCNICLLILGNAQCVCGGGCMLAACPDDSATPTATPSWTWTTTTHPWSPWAVTITTHPWSPWADTTTTHPWSPWAETTTSWWENRRRRRGKRQASPGNSVQRTCHFCFCSPCEGKFDFFNLPTNL